MRVLAISGRFRDAAAALAADDRLVAAASEDVFTRIPGAGYASTGGFPSHAARACLEAAGCGAGDIDEWVLVGEGEAGAQPDLTGSGLPADRAVRLVDPLEADAALAARAGGAPDAVVVCSTRPADIAAFTGSDVGLRRHGQADGSSELGAAARRLAGLLGLSPDEPFGALDRLGLGAEPAYADALESAIAWRGGVAADARALTEAVDRVAGGHVAALGDATSLNQRVQDLRRGLARSFARRLAEVVGDATRELFNGRELGAVSFGGDLFAHPGFRAELGRVAGQDVAVAVVPETAGRALGAAFAGRPSSGGGLPALSLGPSFSDAEIKRTLDNCRLDYVYEPDWPRLLRRVSRMLEQGKLVGWFQGAMAFGPRSMGTRSILCDPSQRYARQNINEYLRQAPIDEPLPVALAPSMVQACVERPPAVPLSVSDLPVVAEWRPRLQSALDARQAIRLHVVSTVQAPALCDLLEHHHERTGVPGLIEANLASPGEPMACTPRDAVRTTYSSAVDALVIGRFVLMKDHWLLRSHVD